MYVHKEHTDQLLCAVVNNVVVWLKKTPTGQKEEAPLMHRQGLRSQEPLTGLEGNNESLVLSSIYEVFFAPSVHILRARLQGFPLCSSLKIIPVAKISFKAQQPCQVVHSFGGEMGLFSCCETGMFKVQLTKFDSEIKVMMGRFVFPYHPHRNV